MRAKPYKVNAFTVHTELRFSLVDDRACFHHIHCPRISVWSGLQFKEDWVNTLPDHKKCINKEERVRHLPGYCP